MGRNPCTKLWTRVGSFEGAGVPMRTPPEDVVYL